MAPSKETTRPADRDTNYVPPVSAANQEAVRTAGAPLDSNTVNTPPKLGSVGMQLIFTIDVENKCWDPARASGQWDNLGLMLKQAAKQFEHNGSRGGQIYDPDGNLMGSLEVVGNLTREYDPRTEHERRTGNGCIEGTVRDKSGHVLSGATVTVTNMDIEELVRTSMTDNQGVYRSELLPPGRYLIGAALPGFKNFEQQNLTVKAGATLQTHIQLELA